MSEKLKSVAACGLYCGACGKFKKETCPGCLCNDKLTWCTVRSCCIEKGYATCAECKEQADPRGCTKLNNFMGKVMGVLFNSDRFACIARIKEVGAQEYALEMEKKNSMSIKRNK